MQIKTQDPKSITSKTRGYLGGQKMSPSQMEIEIIRLSKTHTVKEIHEITGKSERTIKRLRKKAKESGKILTSNSGRITLPEDELAKRQYQSITRDELYEKYRPVKLWIDERTAEAKGNKKKLKQVRLQLGRLKVVCDTTRLNPHSLLSADENGISYGGLKNTMTAFSIALTSQQVVYQIKNRKQLDPDNVEGSYRNHLMACRNFATYNGVSLPKFPPEHILSGKKVGFGQYAHIKMSVSEINQCVQYLIENYGQDSIELAMFTFYYITGTRANSIFNAKTSTVQVLDNGWITCMVYEPKTHTTWKKFIQNDNPHFEILQNWINTRKENAKSHLFSEDGKENKILYESLVVIFKKMYLAIGLDEDYFFKKPVHALRHVMAHYFLDLTDNHGAVAKLGGWKDIQTLISCYAEMTDETIFRILGAT